VTTSGFGLRFTAPGSDLDSEDPAQRYIIKYATTFENLTGPAFESGVNTLLTEEDIDPGSSLTPVAGGQEVLLRLRENRFVAGQLYYFALKAEDAAENQSPVSNVAAGLIPKAEPSGARENSAKVVLVLAALWSVLCVRKYLA
jgi:hypothetical protein